MANDVNELWQTMSELLNEGSAAADRPVYSQDNSLAPGLLREWPDGRLEVVKVDDSGNISVVRSLPARAGLTQD